MLDMALKETLKGFLCKTKVLSKHKKEHLIKLTQINRLFGVLSARLTQTVWTLKIRLAAVLALLILLSLEYHFPVQTSYILLTLNIQKSKREEMPASQTKKSENV